MRFNSLLAVFLAAVVLIEISLVSSAAAEGPQASDPCLFVQVPERPDFLQSTLGSTLAPGDLCLTLSCAAISHISPHLSCQTCLQDTSCAWCAQAEECVSPGFNGENNTCSDAMDVCDCSPFNNCSTCLEPGYCEWCESTKTCYGAGDRPLACTDFREQVCAERVGLSTEYALLASMVLCVLVVLAIVIATYTVKWLRRPRDSDSLVFEDANRALDTLNANYLTEEDMTDDDTSDERDGLLGGHATKRVSAAKPTSLPRMR